MARGERGAAHLKAAIAAADRDDGRGRHVLEQPRRRDAVEVRHVGVGDHDRGAQSRGALEQLHAVSSLADQLDAGQVGDQERQRFTE